MRKIILSLVFVCSSLYVLALPSITEVRYLYQKAALESKSCTKIITLLDTYTEKNNALLAGYKACATMMMANYVTNPYSKLSNFREGKNLLEKCIKTDSENIELRFLRFSVQSKAPSFLGYNSSIKSDKRFLINSIHNLNDSDLKERIISFLKNSEHLTPGEKLKLIK